MDPARFPREILSDIVTALLDLMAHSLEERHDLRRHGASG